MYEIYAGLLKESGKTTYQVSKDTGIAENVFTYWKQGRNNPKVDKLMILADYFGVPVTVFLDAMKKKEETK